MRQAIAFVTLLSLGAADLPLLGSKEAQGAPPPASPALSLRLPWRDAGWTAEQAAAHLLSRFAYGARPGDVEAVVRMGLDRWFERQLAADQPDSALAALLAARPALSMSSAELLAAFSPRRLLRRKRSDAEMAAPGSSSSTSSIRGDRRDPAPERELLELMMEQKVLRAVESENQLVEVMVDFWFNHFNVSFTDRQVRPFLVSYERDALRPHALGRFLDLLSATARHPAMLGYLDNARSSAEPGVPTTFALRMEERRGGLRRPISRPGESQSTLRPRGLNENYARELMELHTLGVDGGYTQRDVTEVARAFTGWTVMPIGERRAMAEDRLERLRRRGGMGFARAGDFFFRADQHDAGDKTVLGLHLPAGRGIEDGEQVLRLLAGQRATARHLARKLAVRFVADEPPAALVDRLTDDFLRSGGDTRQLLRAIVQAPEFWDLSARGAKFKSPFELAVSALRATASRVSATEGVARWIARMGEPLYVNQVPTGYPDRGAAWVNAGTLVTRMNFALDLSAGRIPGVELGTRRDGLASVLASPEFQRR